MKGNEKYWKQSLLDLHWNYFNKRLRKERENWRKLGERVKLLGNESNGKNRIERFRSKKQNNE
jgi:hypothetical protein